MQHTRESIEATVYDALSELLGVSAKELGPDTPLGPAGLALDSLDRTDIVIELEAELDLTISDEEAESWATVQNIVDFLANKAE